jgi:hypothetical protein
LTSGLFNGFLFTLFLLTFFTISLPSKQPLQSSNCLNLVYPTNSRSSISSEDVETMSGQASHKWTDDQIRLVLAQPVTASGRDMALLNNITYPTETQMDAIQATYVRRKFGNDPRFQT